MQIQTTSMSIGTQQPDLMSSGAFASARPFASGALSQNHAAAAFDEGRYAGKLEALNALNTMSGSKGGLDASPRIFSPEGPLSSGAGGAEGGGEAGNTQCSGGQGGSAASGGNVDPSQIVQMITQLLSGIMGGMGGGGGLGKLIGGVAGSGAA
jgi:hypothetical protein